MYTYGLLFIPCVSPIYRDMKPDNILLDDHGKLQLCMVLCSAQCSCVCQSIRLFVIYESDGCGVLYVACGGIWLS